jgi:hypothetical protein
VWGRAAASIEDLAASLSEPALGRSPPASRQVKSFWLGSPACDSATDCADRNTQDPGAFTLTPPLGEKLPQAGNGLAVQ